MNTLEVEHVKGLMENLHIDTSDETIVEGFKEVIQNFRMKRFQSKFLQKGSTTIYYIKSQEHGKFVKAVFENSKLADQYQFSSPAEMEEDINFNEAAGFKVLSEAGIKKVVKFLLRNFGRLLMGVGLIEVIGGTLIALAVGMGGGSVVLGLPIALFAGSLVAKFVVVVGGGWAIARAAKKETALQRNHGKELGGVQMESFSIVEGDNQEQIRQLVREQIRKQAEKTLEKENEQPAS